MADTDKQISALPAATSVDDGSLFVVEQQGAAMSASGALWKGFAVQAVQPFANNASASAAAAANSATQAASSAAAAAQSATAAGNSAESAAESAETAQQYSGKPPIIQNDTWWVWNAETGQYEDTGESARGDVMYATFEVDPITGILTMYTPDLYDGPTFAVVDGYLEVTISA